MATPKRKINKEAIKHAVTHGQEQPRKLPETIELTKSQALALRALNNDERQLREQARQVNANLEATVSARVEILQEIGKAQSLNLGDFDRYQFDGSVLILHGD